MNRIAFKDLTNNSFKKMKSIELKRKTTIETTTTNNTSTDLCFNMTSFYEQENIETSINKVKRLRLSDSPKQALSFSGIFTEATKSLADSLLNRIKTSINEDTSDSGLGVETISASSQANLDSDYDDEQNQIFENFPMNMSDLEDECENDQSINDLPKFAKNKLFDLSNCSIKSNTSPLSSSFQARRCLFKLSPTPQQTKQHVSKLNLSTPNKVILKSTDTCLETNIDSNCKPITPISSYRNNSIIINDQNFSFNTSITIKNDEQPQPQELAVASAEEEDDEDDEYTHNLKDIHKMIMQSLDYECSQQQHQSTRLIGDRSRHHLLPCKSTIKHNDLNVITPTTFKQVLDGVYDKEIAKLIVIDARYPYEYDGGHIKNAHNVFTREKLIEMFLDNRDKLTKDLDQSKRLIIIFHCEFSSERGPNLLRFLRNQDREVNKDAYPKLFYPELYLLEGGYKAFYEKSRDYCEPKTYKPMLHEDHVQDLKHFRLKAKTWDVVHKQMSSISASAYKTTTGSSYTRTSRISSITSSKFQRFQSNLF